MIIGERLKGVLKHRKISAKIFAEMVGVTEGMIYKYYKMDAVDSKTLSKWAETLCVPIMTFMSDEFYERTTHKVTKDEVDKAQQYYEENKNIIKYQNRLIFESPFSGKEELNSLEEKIVPRINTAEGVPYYNVDFIGGFDIVLNDQTLKPEYLIDFKKYNEATCWCNVTGHSMEPEITHGDIIALKRIEDISFLPLGEVYAIVTTNGMRTIKRLGPSNDPKCYTLVPTNKSPEYGIQEIPKSMITHVYQVLGCMKRL